jgi:hypothetical protein
MILAVHVNTLYNRHVAHQTRESCDMQSKEEQALVGINNVWNSLCPQSDSGFVWQLVSELKADGEYDTRTHCRAAVGKLWNGLAYGNWPSVSATRES